MADTAAVILGTLPRFRNSVEAPTKQRAVLDAGPGRKTAWQDCPKERLPEWTAGPQLENGPELAEDCYQGRRTAPAQQGVPGFNQYGMHHLPPLGPGDYFPGREFQNTQVEILNRQFH